MKIFSVLLFITFWNFSSNGQSIVGNVSFEEYEEYILTHQLIPSGPVPTALDPNGVYPYVSYSETSNRPGLKRYRFIALENEKMKVTICPDLGGKSGPGPGRFGTCGALLV